MQATLLTILVASSHVRSTGHRHRLVGMEVKDTTRTTLQSTGGRTVTALAETATTGVLILTMKIEPATTTGAEVETTGAEAAVTMAALEAAAVTITAVEVATTMAEAAEAAVTITAVEVATTMVEAVGATMMTGATTIEEEEEVTIGVATASREGAAEITHQIGVATNAAIRISPEIRSAETAGR